MSVKLIDSNKTIATVKDGVTWYSNPALRISITSDGKVFNNSSGRFLKQTSAGLYSVYYTTGTEYSNPTSFDSLVSHMLGITKTRGEKLELLIKSNGYVKDNIKVVKNTDAWKRSHKKEKSLDTSVKMVAPQIHILETTEAEIKGYRLKVIKAEHQFITEDNRYFNSHKDALAHQLLVDKGKESALMIIGAKAGHVLAQQIFEQHVPGKGEYKNFKEMLDNNSGIVEVGTNPIYKFIPQPNMGEFKDLITEKEFSKDEVEKAAELLKVLTDTTNELLTMLV